MKRKLYDVFDNLLENTKLALNLTLIVVLYNTDFKTKKQLCNIRS